jgi:predicted aspartyl protease
MTRVLTLLMLAAGLAGCAGPHDQLMGRQRVEQPPCGVGQHFDLPVTAIGRGLAVAARINDRPVQLMIDTGAEQTAISAKLFSALHMTDPLPKQSAVLGFGGKGKATTSTIMLDSFSAGPIQESRMLVGVIDDLPTAGVLGLDILAKYDVDFDMPHGKVTLYTKGLCPGQRPDWPGEVKHLDAVRGIVSGPEYDRVVSAFLLIVAKVDNEPMLAMLDSGNLSAHVLSQRIAERMGITAEQIDQAPTVEGSGAAGRETSRAYQFRQLVVGGETFAQPRMTISANKQLRTPLILGTEYFRHHRIWFNFASNSVFVSPVAE